MAQIEVSAEKLERVTKLLREFPGAAHKAISSSINRGLITLRAKSAQEISRAYNISSSKAKESGNMKMHPATGSEMSASITFAGTVIPLISFSVSYGGAAAGSSKNGNVSASVKKHGVRAALKHAYVANLGHGLGVFERESSLRESSKQLYGPSMAHMMEEESVVEKVTDAAQKTINTRIEHEITRILNGYGG